MSKTVKRPLNQDERDAIEMMRGVTFPVASWDKRFARDVLFHCLDTGEIGEKSAPQLWRIFIRYRRQTGNYAENSHRKAELMKLAEKLSAPDFRKQQAALREQAEIDRKKAEYAQAMALCAA